MLRFTNAVTGDIRNYPALFLYKIPLVTLARASGFTKSGVNSLNLPLGLWPTSHTALHVSAIRASA